MFIRKFYDNFKIFRKSYTNKKIIFLIVIISTILILLYTNEDLDDSISPIFEYNSIDVTNQKFLVDTENCKIPKLPPITKEIKSFVSTISETKCTDRDPLTYIEYRDNIPYLVVNKSISKLYADRLDCCFREVSRSTSPKQRDHKITYSTCVPFYNEVQLNISSIKVSCKHESVNDIYSNVHGIVLPVTSNKNETNKFSVILLGIDSISKLNFMRSFPKTYEHVKNNYIELQGYNKIGDNTFPNLGGILSGMSKPRIQQTCHYQNKFMDPCYFIWKDFKTSGYYTGYAEDEINVSTFNLEGSGFLDPPTDVYLRPYMISAEELGCKRVYGMCYCSGPENSGKRIINIAKNFALPTTNKSSFGLFWMNSFSHDNINLASTMDIYFYNLLVDIEFSQSIEENTFFIFLSDHGFRFGNIRFTYTGWLEERLPFIYIHVPKIFKKRFPEEYKNLLDNRFKLTSPYDLYMTLQHLLQIGNNTHRIRASDACANCVSLFNVINENRSCDDAGISPHWCTCKGYHSINTKEPILISIAHYVLNYINEIVHNTPKGSACHKYSLDNIFSAAVTKTYTKQGKSVKYFLVLIETSPAAMFEATVEMISTNLGNTLNLSGEVSRLNKYSPHSQCMKNSDIEKYCYCKSIWSTISEMLCSILPC